MKGALVIIAFLLTAVAVAADYPAPNSYFVFKGASCQPNGVIEFNVTHSGETLKIPTLITNIEGEKLANQTLLGGWYLDGDPNPINQYNYTGSDFVSATRFTFISNTGIYTAGKYIITLSWPSSSIYYDNIKFSVECPGIQCATDDQCIAQQSCTNKMCQWIVCAPDEHAAGHTCFNRCDDNNKCTEDRFIDGQCVNVKAQGCCITSDDCNAYESCKQNRCVKPMFASTSDNIFTRLWHWLFGN